ncbi:hypothetical protein [Vibrio sp. B181a]|uniref:hypothetical protein n=1 Tax=Vibrio sp. B181a TaxID=2835906 RepID=UPI002555F709|nr:hypothetical protein [Vibrio sp. B181a]MDK9770474.1 hypothetical protein [Vibrio sp. B181a]
MSGNLFLSDESDWLIKVCMLKAIQFCTRSEGKFLTHTTDLKEEEFYELKIARERLVKVLNHEELYDQVIESYVDAKSAMYEMSIRSLADGINNDYIKGHNKRSKLNRLFFNTLNLSKLYLDRHYRENKGKDHKIKSVSCFVHGVTNKDTDLDEVASQRSAILELNKDYALGCELRNFVQHASLPVKNFVSGVNYDPETRNSLAVFHVPLDKQVLIEGGVKKKKLEGYCDQIDLHKVMDGYINAISEMHMRSRALVATCVEESESLIHQKRKEIESNFEGLQYGVDIVDHEKRLFSLHLEWFEVVKHLMKKNSHTLDFKRFSHKPYDQRHL